MKKWLFLIVLLIIFSTPTYAALTYPTSPKGTPRISKQYVMPEIRVGKVDGYDHIVMLGLDDFTVTGAPILPFKTIRLLLPLDQDLESIEIIPEQKTYLPGKYNIGYGKMPIPLSWLYSEVVRENFAKSMKPELREEELNKTILKTEKNETIYSMSEEYPGKIYSVISTQTFRGYKILILNIFPVQYIPKTGEVYYFKKINVNVYSNTISRDEIELKLNNFRALDKDKLGIEKAVDNPTETSTYKAEYKVSSTPISGAAIVNPGEQWDYVIITKQDFVVGFQGLATWKNSQGIDTTIVKVEDIYSQYTGRDNQEKIRNFIKDAYANWEIEYVLLGGDADGADVGGESGNNIIPVRRFWAMAQDGNDGDLIPADMYYSNLDGTFDSDNDGIYGEPGDGCDINADCEVDLYSEVYIGRAPVDSVQEVNNFVSKTIAYENSNDPYLRKALMIGEYLGFGGVSDYGDSSKEEIRLGSSEHGYTTEGFYKGFTIDLLYDGFYLGCDGISDPDCWHKKELIARMNSNSISIFNHLGHASTCYAMKLCNAPSNSAPPNPSGGPCLVGEERYGISTNVDDLMNSKPFFVYSQGCYPGAFDNWNYEGYYTTCDSIGEHFVTSAHGAFAVIMNSRYGWGVMGSTDGASERYDRQFFDAVFGEGITELGKANQDSKEDNIGSIGGVMRWSYYELNLLGDPTVKLKIDYSAPQAEITSPKQNDMIAGTTEIKGMAKKGKNPGSTFQKYEIYYGLGTNPTQWFSNAIALVNNGTSPVNDGLLATFNTATIDNGIYTIKLIVTDNMGLTTESKTTVRIGAKINIIPISPQHFSPSESKTMDAYLVFDNYYFVDVLNGAPIQNTPIVGFSNFDLVLIFKTRDSTSKQFKVSYMIRSFNISNEKELSSIFDENTVTYVSTNVKTLARDYGFSPQISSELRRWCIIQAMGMSAEGYFCPIDSNVFDGTWNENIGIKFEGSKRYDLFNLYSSTLGSFNYVYLDPSGKYYYETKTGETYKIFLVALDFYEPFNNLNQSLNLKIFNLNIKDVSGYAQKYSLDASFMYFVNFYYGVVPSRFEFYVNEGRDYISYLLYRELDPRILYYTMVIQGIRETGEIIALKTPIVLNAKLNYYALITDRYDSDNKELYFQGNCPSPETSYIEVKDSSGNVIHRQNCPFGYDAISFSGKPAGDYTIKWVDDTDKYKLAILEGTTHFDGTRLTSLNTNLYYKCYFNNSCDWKDTDSGCCYRCFYTDINGDTYVNAKDSVILGTSFGTKPGDAKWNPAADINKDNHVNAMDAVAFGQKFGASC